MANPTRTVSGHRPRKRFGQHFLRDAQALSRIANAATSGNPANLLEIGPGLGALTGELVNRVPRLVAVELDRDLAAKLQNQYSPERLTVHQMDILDCELAALDRPSPAEPFRVVGNLPYNISTPLMFHLVSQLEQIESMVFLVQKEVALRIVAGPGSKTYGRLSVMAALDLDSEILFEVPPEAFDPPPRVDSTVIRLLPRSARDGSIDRQSVTRLVSTAFAQRRKTLRNALSGMVSDGQFAAAGIDPRMRAEALWPDDFVRLSKTLE